MTAVGLFMMPSCSKTKQYRIGVSQCSDDDWREKMNEEIRREAMFHEDATVEIRSADDSSDKQIEDIRYFIDNDFDIIIVAPNEAEALTPVIKEAYDKGIPVIVFDRDIKGDSYTARVGADNDALGRNAAVYAASILRPSPKAIEIRGLDGSTPAQGRHDGFKTEFESDGGTIVASACGRWNQAVAERLTDSLLRVYDDIDLIYAHNDRMAIGASNVARRMGRDSIRVIGIDAAPAIGIQAVADGVIDATLLYPTEGHLLLRQALAILKGQPYNRETVLPMTSVVNATNADILLVQNEALQDETEKMELLKKEIDEYWERHSAQTMVFYASIAIIILLVGVVFLVVRAYWQHRKHRAALLEQNKILEEQRDKERELNEKLREATQSKLMFFTNVSHDLRTPLTLIAEPVAQLVDADNLTPEQRTMMKLADKNVRILRRLINQILDFRKYENDKMELNLTEVNLGQALADWLESFHALAHKRRMKLTSDFGEGADKAVAVDVEKMERVVFNLISNAFKYTPDNGEITLTYAVDDDKAVITVADTGRGISERDLGNIFDRFYQVEHVHPNGSGIGLTLSKAFVELHGGTIEVESTLKKGSVFKITLPVRHVGTEAVDVVPMLTSADVEAELDVIDEQSVFDDAKPLLLVIDDNRDIQQLMKSLMATDYNVLTASNGSEGIRKAVKYVPDIIICDVMMPGMDGMECCRRLKDEITTSHIPVLMLTACSMDEQRVEGYESGADGYLSKPFSGSVLAARCKSLIDNRKRIKELLSSGDSPAPLPVAEAKPRPGDIDNDFYNRFLTIFDKEMANADLSVDVLASKMGLERTQFYRKIKALTNYSPVELIRNLRLKHARRMLTSTDKSVSEIAYDCGFSTPAYFTRCFRDAYGQTPSDLRNSLNG